MRRSAMTLATIIIAIGAVGGAEAATLRVPSEYAAIKTAVNAASAGDTVLVAPGTYTGPDNTNIRFDNRDLVVVSEGGPEATIVDCEGIPGAQGFELVLQTQATLLEGFTVRRASGTWGAITILAGSPVVRNCICEEGTTWSNGSGGISVSVGANARVEDCIARYNIGAGGFFVGGGAYAEFIRCQIIENEGGAGGGLVWDQAEARMEDCVISGNVSGSGGGLVVHVARLELVRCVINENYAARYGGGIHVDYLGELIARECTVARNTSGQGGGGITKLGLYGSILLDRTIVSGNCAPQGSDMYINCPITVTCSAVAPAGIFLGIYGEITYTDPPVIADPLFCAPGSCPGGIPDPVGDYHIRSDSPCLPQLSPCGELIGALGVGCPGIPIGACCDGPVCRVATWADCITQGGIYVGDDSGCSPNPCVPIPIQRSTWGRIKAAYR